MNGQTAIPRAPVPRTPEGDAALRDLDAAECVTYNVTHPLGMLLMLRSERRRATDPIWAERLDRMITIAEEHREVTA